MQILDTAAAENLQAIREGCKQRLLSCERGRKGLAGELVGSRDVNAGERRRKGLSTFGCWKVGEKWPLQPGY